MTKTAKKEEEREGKVVASNRDARRSYEILETYEAGLSLEGSEVKSLRTKGASLAGAFGRVENGQAYLHNFQIPNYPQALQPPDPRRTRKLLLHQKEIKRLAGRLETRGLTLVPLEVYFKRGWAKVSLALGRGKKGPDRREDLRRRTVEREMEKSFKGKFKA